MKTKRQRLWLLINLLVLIASCSLVVALIVRVASGLSSNKEIEQSAIRELDAILQAARDNPVGPPPEAIQRWALLMPGDELWLKLQHWMIDAPGSYQLELLSGDSEYSPGDDAVVRAKLSTGITITCTFYNSTLVGCDETEE